MKMSWSRVFLYSALLTLIYQLNVTAQEAPQVLIHSENRDVRAATLAYWTPERMQTAIPMELQLRRPDRVHTDVLWLP